jgi:hypothetical protein
MASAWQHGQAPSGGRYLPVLRCREKGELHSIIAQRCQGHVKFGRDCVAMITDSRQGFSMPADLQQPMSGKCDGRHKMLEFERVAMLAIAAQRPDAVPQMARGGDLARECPSPSRWDAARPRARPAIPSRPRPAWRRFRPVWRPGKARPGVPNRGSVS